MHMDLLCNAMDTQELREKKNPMDHFTYGFAVLCVAKIGSAMVNIKDAEAAAWATAFKFGARHPNDYIKGDRQTLETTVGAQLRKPDKSYVVVLSEFRLTATKGIPQVCGCRDYTNGHPYVHGACGCNNGKPPRWLHQRWPPNLRNNGGSLA